jgi:hypothetical protein
MCKSFLYQPYYTAILDDIYPGPVVVSIGPIYSLWQHGERSLLPIVFSSLIKKSMHVKEPFYSSL